MDKYPAIPVLLVLILGIFAGFSSCLILGACCIAGGILLSILYWKLLKSRVISYYWFWIPLFLIVLSSGVFRANYAETKPEEISPNVKNIYLRVDEISDTENSMKIIGSIVSVSDSTGAIVGTSHEQSILVYIQGIDYSVYPGTIVLIPNKLSLIENMGNPDEFDYKIYMERQGIFYRQFVKIDEYEVCGEDPTLLNRIARYKMKLIKGIMSSSLATESKHFLAAVLLGEKQYIDYDVRQLYSNIGIAHLLALSGLHVGIISMLIFLLLFPIDYITDKRVRIIITSLSLIAYAILTGLSVSVVRATIITVLCGISFCLRRKVNHVNLLAFAAIFILIINPIWIYDVGFQLSFAAVLFILLLANKINPINRRSGMLYNVVGLITVTISASLGTFIISAYYFHVIPIVFLIPNVILLPLLPILLCIGLFAVFTDYSLLIRMFDGMFGYVNHFFERLESLPVAFIDYVDIHTIDIVFYYIILGLLIFVIYNRRYLKAVLPIMGCLCVFWCVSCMNQDKSSDGLLIMNHYRETPVIVHSSGTANIILPSDSISFVDFAQEFSQYNKSYMACRNIKNIVKYDISHISYFMNAIAFDYSGNTFVIVDSKLSKDTLPEKERFACKYLVVTKNYYASVARILSKFSPDTIILSGNIYENRRQKIKLQLDESGVPYYDIKERGAFVLE